MTQTANAHLSGAPLFDQDGKLAAITQYQDSNGYVATLVEELSAGQMTDVFLSRIVAHSFVGSENVVSRHEAAGPRCNALTALDDRLDELTQVGLDYQNRELILAFPQSYVDYIANIERSLPAAIAAITSEASCGCTSQAIVSANAILLGAQLQRRINAVAEFRRLTTEALFFPRRDVGDAVTLTTSVAEFCSKLQWIVMPSIQLQIGPLDWLMVCGIATASNHRTVGDIVKTLFPQSVVDADVCSALPVLNSRLGWQLSCPAALDSWRRIAVAVAPEMKWRELGDRANQWKQVLLWKGAQREGLVVGSSKLIEHLSGVSAKALDQDAGIPIEIGATKTALRALPLVAGSRAVSALAELIRQLDALPQELAGPLSASTGTSADLFNAVVTAFPDTEPTYPNGRPFRTGAGYVIYLDGVLRRLQASLRAFIQESAKGLQAECVSGSAVSSNTTPMPPTP